MGLLDQMFQNPDAANALGLLGANMMAGNTPQGFAQASGLLAQGPERRLKQKLLEAQYAETMAQADERKQKMALAQQIQARQDAFLNGDGGMSPGAFTPSAGGMGPTLPQSAAPQAGGLVARARALGIPEDAIRADVVFNGGKKIAEFIDKHGSSDMQVSNGYLYDKNRTGAGFLPQLSTSQSGQTSMIQIGPDGLPVVSAPTGAQNTYAGYRNIDESAKANFDPLTVTPQGQPPQMTSRGALMRSPQVQGLRPGADAGRAEILNQEVTKAQGQLKIALQAGDSTAAQRATNDLAALNRELQGVGGASRASVGMPLQSAAEKAALVKQAESDVVPAAAKTAMMDTANQTLSVLDKALAHPGLDKSTGLGSLNPLNQIPGTDAKNFSVVMDQIKGKTFMQAYQSLKGGGQITEIEGQKATEAIARLNTAQSTPEFRAALNELRDIVVGARARMDGGSFNPPPASGGWSIKKVN